MNRLALVWALAACLFATAGCSALGKADVGRILTSGRDGWQHPERVIESLDVSPGEQVAEIGAGDGYWLPWLSEAVGQNGRVYAVEVTDDKVAALEELVADEGWENVVVVRGEFEDPLLPDGEIDLAMTCLTYHHIEGQVTYFTHLHRDLSPRGRVAHLDDPPDSPAPFSWFQGSGHWTDPEVIRTEMAEAGYVRTEEFDFLPVQSFQIFAPTSESED